VTDAADHSVTTAATSHRSPGEEKKRALKIEVKMEVKIKHRSMGLQFALPCHSQVPSSFLVLIGVFFFFFLNFGLFDKGQCILIKTLMFFILKS